jgi:hypothetical protein
MGHLFGLKRYKDISRIYSMYKITMGTSPQLPFDIISKILQDRKNILQEERQIKETKENFFNCLKEIKGINEMACNDGMDVEDDGIYYIRTLLENIIYLEEFFTSWSFLSQA